MPRFNSQEEREAFWIRVYEDGGPDYVAEVEGWSDAAKTRLLNTYRAQRQEALNKNNN